MAVISGAGAALGAIGGALGIGGGAAAAGAAAGGAGLGATLAGTGAVLTGGSALLGALQEGAAIDREMRLSLQEAERLRKAYQNAQQLLNKEKDQQISDIEASNLRAQGLITDAEEALITDLNRTEAGAIETLNRYVDESDKLYATTEQLVVDDMIQSGIITRDTINQGILENIKATTGITDDAIKSVIAGSNAAIDTLQLTKKEMVDAGIAAREELAAGADEATAILGEFEEPGKRGLERMQFLSGLLTPEERETHVQEFGEIEGSPIFQFRVREREEQLERRQRALGRVFSGAGLEEFREELDVLTAEEAERQEAQARQLTQLGLTTAQARAEIARQRGVGLAQQREQEAQRLQQLGLTEAEARRQAGLTQAELQRGLAGTLAGIRERGVGLTAEQRMAETAGLAGVRQAIGLQRAGLRERTGGQLAQLGLGVQQARQNIRQNALMNRLAAEQQRLTGVTQARQFFLPTELQVGLQAFEQPQQQRMDMFGRPISGLPSPVFSNLQGLGGGFFPPFLRQQQQQQQQQPVLTTQ